MNEQDNDFQPSVESNSTQQFQDININETSQYNSVPTGAIGSSAEGQQPMNANQSTVLHYVI